MKKKFIVILFEITLVVWILACLYIWIVLEFITNPGLIIVRSNIPSKIINTLEKNRQAIWPYVWRDYIYTPKQQL